MMSEPTLSGTELDRAILDAYRELLAAIRARPRDQRRIDDAQAEYDALLALRNGG
jgi:hypothetical protein